MLNRADLKIIAVIPARYEASRFPGKLMEDLGGMSVIRRTYEATVATQLFDEVFVVTDSDIIFQEIEKHGGKVLKSQREHTCGSDRIAEIVENIDTDIVVNVQGDEPFTVKESLDKVLSVFFHENAENIDLASLMTPLHDTAEINNPNNVKVIVDKTNSALYFSRSPIPYPRDAEKATLYYKHIGIYAFRKKALMQFYQWPMTYLESVEKIECIRYLEHGKNMKMVETSIAAIGIDTPEDLEKARAILAKTD